MILDDYDIRRKEYMKNFDGRNYRLIVTSSGRFYTIFHNDFHYFDKERDSQRRVMDDPKTATKVTALHRQLAQAKIQRNKVQMQAIKKELNSLFNKA